MTTIDRTTHPWLAPADQQYLNQDFTNINAHRLADGSERASTLALARMLNVTVTRVTIPLETGSVDVVVFSNLSGRTKPGLLYIHGGGHMFGDAYSQAAEVVHWVADLGITVFSVDYRLSPENPYPAAFDDCVGVMSWLRSSDNTHSLTSDPFVYGASAGGGIAAAIAIHTAADDQRLAGLILGSPMLDHRTRVAEGGTARFHTWTAANNVQGWAAYLGNLEAGSIPSTASPTLADFPSSVTRLYLDTGTHDLFLREDLDFARRAIAAGAEVEIHAWANGYHGFEVLDPASPASRTARRFRRDWLARALEGTSS